MIKCDEFREIVHDLLRDEALDPAVVEDAFVHTESCNACYTFFGEAELLHISLRSLAAHHASGQAPPRVQEALLAELARMNSPLPSSSHRWPNRWMGWAGGVAGLAAAAVLLIFMMVHRGATLPDIGSQQHASRAVPAYELNAVPDSEGELSADDETAAGSFVPLSDSFDPSSLDDATVVRVVLSPSALESLGVPFNGSDGDQMVADLVLANDGMPEAIRLVAWQVSEE
jgi:hypothetical protein